MKHRRLALHTFLLLAFLALGSFGEHLLARQSSQTSAPPQAEQAPTQLPTIKSETRAVRVDVIVTDKKGNYVHDLKAGDFKVYEDNKQQPIVNFSFGVNPSAPASAQRRYLVLFFDNSTMAFSDQPQARAAAAKFIDQNAGPDRVMAVVQFRRKHQNRAEFHGRSCATKESGGTDRNFGSEFQRGDLEHWTWSQRRPFSRIIEHRFRHAGQQDDGFWSAEFVARDSKYGAIPGKHSRTKEHDPVYFRICDYAGAPVGINGDDRRL